MGYTVWDNMWEFGYHCGKKKRKGEAIDAYRYECVCRVVEDEEDGRKEHGCDCPKCQRSHSCHC